jgi:type IV secretion system protein VirB10
MSTEDQNGEQTPEPGASPVEESITQVGEDSEKKGIPVWLIGVVVVMLVLIVLSMGGEGEKKDDKAGVDFTNEQYEVKGNPAPAMPKQAPPPKPVIPSRQANPVIDLSNELTPEQKQEARKAKELAAKRQRAPLVLVNKRRTKADESQPNIRDEASQRMAELQRNTQDALRNLAGGGQQAETSPADLSTSDVELVDAGYVVDRSYKLLQGKIIPAILETAINSDLPGMLRASVSESVYSEDGNVLLIPKGSRLIGEYRSGLKRGQSRVFVIWSRMVRPDGIDIKMDSPGTDTLGRAGLGGFVDTHFIERFGSSALLSLIGSFAQQESQNDNQREAVADSFNKSAEIALEDSINIAPTIHINQGERINVFVAKDLNFKQAILYAQRANKF